jgi:chromosome partitioning protein
MGKCRIIAAANQKGGVGKTTTICNLGQALADLGYRVLLVDFDPQSNLTMSFGIENPDKIPVSMHDVLSIIMDDTELSERKKLPDKTDFIFKGEKLDLIPCNIQLSVTEINMRNVLSSERTLLELLEPLRPDYDFILIDTSPSLGLLTINALSVCDEVIIPMSMQLWSATGLADLMKTISSVRKKINPKINISGILLTIYDGRTRLSREAEKLVNEHYGDTIKIFKTNIPHTVKIGEANYASRSIINYDAENKAAIAYKKFAKEVLDNAK